MAQRHPLRISWFYFPGYIEAHASRGGWLVAVGVTPRLRIQWDGSGRVCALRSLRAELRREWSR